MGLTDFVSEPHKFVKSVLIILLLFFMSKIFVFLFDGIDGVEDGYINVGTCPNIPIVDNIYSFTLSLINLKCEKQGGMTYEQALQFLNNNYSIDDALKNSLFRVNVPMASFFRGNISYLNQFFIGVEGEDVYKISNEQKIFAVWNDYTYYIPKTLLGFDIGAYTHPIYQLYFVYNNKTGDTQLLIFDKEGWSKIINQSIDLNGLDPTDVIVYKINPNIPSSSNVETFVEKLPFISDLETYNLNPSNLINDKYSYTSFNIMETSITEPYVDYFNITATKNGKLTEPLDNGFNLSLQQLTNILGVSYLNYIKGAVNEDNYEKLAENGADYIIFKFRLIDNNTGKFIYPAYLKAVGTAYVLFKDDEGNIKAIQLDEYYDIGSFYPFYSGFITSDGSRLYFNLPFPLREIKKDLYYAFANLPEEFNNYKVDSVVLFFRFWIYPLNKNKSVELKMSLNDDGEGFYVHDVDYDYFQATKEELIDVIEGKQRINDRVKKYAICDWYYKTSLIVGALGYIDYLICNELKEKTGSDKAEYFMEAISYNPYSELTIYN